MNDPRLDLLRQEVDRRTANPPMPPTPERVLRAVRRQRRVTIASAVVAVVVAGSGTAAVLSAGHDSATRPLPPTHQTSPAPVQPAAGPLTQQQARERAHELLAHLLVPPSAVEVNSPPAPTLTQPAQVTSLAHSAQDARFWTLKGSIGDASQFFNSHEENGATPNGFGHGSGRKLTDTSVTVLYDEVNILIVYLTADTVGIRASSQVAWSPSKPAREHVPDDVTSVDLIAYRIASVVPDAQKTVFGATARHLVSLANAMPLSEVGVTSCPADGPNTGLRKVIFHSPTTTVVITGFFCGFAHMVVDGKDQPVLAPGGLASAVDQLLGPVPHEN